MDKLSVFILLALVASVSCSPLGDNAETELLIGYERLFSDFCISQGQKIKSDLRELYRQTSSHDITSIFFGGLNEISDDVINVQKEAVAQLAAQLDRPYDEEDPTLREDIARLAVESKKAIKRTNEAAQAAHAMMGSVGSALFSRLAEARDSHEGLTFFNKFKAACERVARYEQQMSHALGEAKQDILDDIGKDVQVEKFVQEVNIADLNCYTTKDIVRLHGFCDTIQAGHKFFFRMLRIEKYA